MILLVRLSRLTLCPVQHRCSDWPTLGSTSCPHPLGGESSGFLCRSSTLFSHSTTSRSLTFTTFSWWCVSGVRLEELLLRGYKKVCWQHLALNQRGPGRRALIGARDSASCWSFGRERVYPHVEAVEHAIWLSASANGRVNRTFRYTFHPRISPLFFIAPCRLPAPSPENFYRNAIVQLPTAAHAPHIRTIKVLIPDKRNYR